MSTANAPNRRPHRPSRTQPTSCSATSLPTRPSAQPLAQRFLSHVLPMFCTRRFTSAYINNWSSTARSTLRKQEGPSPRKRCTLEFRIALAPNSARQKTQIHRISSRLARQPLTPGVETLMHSLGKSPAKAVQAVSAIHLLHDLLSSLGPLLGCFLPRPHGRLLLAHRFPEHGDGPGVPKHFPP